MKDRLLKLNISMNRNYQKIVKKITLSNNKIYKEIRKSKNKNEVNQHLNLNFE